MTLKELRKAKGLKLRKVAAVVGVTAQTVYEWENGRRKPKLENVIKLAKIYKVKPLDILAMVNGLTVDELTKKLRNIKSN